MTLKGRLWYLSALGWTSIAYAQKPVELAPNAPADRPMSAAFCQWRAAAKAMEPYIRQAQATYPAARARFQADLSPRHTMFVTTRLRDDRGRHEQVFVVVDTILGDRIAGRIWSRINLVTGYRLGQPYVVHDSALVDWMIAKPDGSEEGNVVGKFLDTYQPPASCSEGENIADTTVRLGSVQRDLTGDGSPELLTLIGVGPSIDSLNVTFTIESRGERIYEMTLVPLTRRIGYDGDRRMRSREEQRAFLAGYGRWFFGDSKFMTPAEFVLEWRRQAPARVDAIPSTVAKAAGFGSDSLRGAEIWSEMQRSGVTIFEFSPGGDSIIPLGWSQHHQRFFRLAECC